MAKLVTPDARTRDLQRRAATDPEAAAALARDLQRRAPPPVHGDIIFKTPTCEILRLCGDGTIKVKGEIVDNARDLVDALRAWIVKCTFGMGSAPLTDQINIHSGVGIGDGPGEAGGDVTMYSGGL